MMNLKKSIETLRKKYAMLKIGEGVEPSPVYLENCQNAIWLFNIQNTYFDF